MKKLILVAGVWMMAIASFAAGNAVWNPQLASQLAFTDKDTAGALAYLDTVKLDTDAIKIDVINFTIVIKAPNSKINTIAEATAEADRLIAKAGGLTGDAGVSATDSRNETIAKILYYAQKNQLLLDFNATLPNGIADKILIAYSYNAAGGYGKDPAMTRKAIAIFIDLKRYDVAFVMAALIGDYVNCLEYSKQALLSQDLSVTEVTNILTRLWEIDFSGTTITPQMQYDMLCAVNSKYSKMLVTDKASWEPIMTRIQNGIAAQKLQLKK